MRLPLLSLIIALLVMIVDVLMHYVPSKPLIHFKTALIIFYCDLAMFLMMIFVVPAVLAYRYGYNSGRKGSFFHDAFSFKPLYADVQKYLDSAACCKKFTLKSGLVCLDRAIYRCAMWGNQRGIRHCPDNPEAKYWDRVFYVGRWDCDNLERYGENWREVVRAKILQKLRRRAAKARARASKSREPRQRQREREREPSPRPPPHPVLRSVERKQDPDQGDDVELSGLLPKTAKADGDGKGDVVEEQRTLTGNAEAESWASRPTYTPDDAIANPGPPPPAPDTSDDPLPDLPTYHYHRPELRSSEMNRRIELSFSNP